MPDDRALRQLQDQVRADLQAGLQPVISGLEDVREAVAGVRILLATHQAEAAATRDRVAGHQRTLYGDRGDNGVVGDVRDLKQHRRITLGLIAWLGTLTVAVAAALVPVVLGGG